MLAASDNVSPHGGLELQRICHWDLHMRKLVATPANREASHPVGYRDSGRIYHTQRTKGPKASQPRRSTGS